MSHIVTERPGHAPGRASSACDLSDAAFLQAFEACALGADAFRHYEHVRLAWLYLDGAPVEEATERMAAAIRRFALHHTGTTAKYNESLTHAWMRLVAHVRSVSAAAPTFSDFASAHPMLFDRQRAFAFYGVAAP